MGSPRVIDRRCRHLVERAIADTGLDLAGATILTEAASGYYALTPLIAAMAGARKVYAMGRDSFWGTRASVREHLTGLAEGWGLAQSIDILEHRDAPCLNTVDIVTNLGFVRPIDEALLRRLSDGVSVSLMWETWEYRAQDLDLAFCRECGIPVLGTDEQHPKLCIFDYVGRIAVKLLLENNIEITCCKICVLGEGVFAGTIASALRVNGADVLEVAPHEIERCRLAGYDALVVINHPRVETVVGSPGGLDIKRLCVENPGIVCAHISGGINTEEAALAELSIIPSRLSVPGYMSLATDYVGPRPLIYLHAAGLAVGQAMRKARLSGVNGRDAELAALRDCAFAQDFPDRVQN